VDPDGNVIRFGSALASPEATDGGSKLLAGDDPIAVAATSAVQAGDLDRLERLLRDDPDLATARIGDSTISRTLLHAATDWPGHYPNVVQVIDVLARAGADVNARFHGPHQETPLHWAASSDDVDALDALLDAGADIEAPGAVLGGGSPLADACGFGQWNAARRLVERGASTRLKDAAALGLADRIAAAFNVGPTPSKDEVTQALWSACHGGQREAAAVLLDRGADVNWVGWDGLTPLDVATQAEAGELADWLRRQGARTAAELSS
jgi:ankyrin repeat protein